MYLKAKAWSKIFYMRSSQILWAGKLASGIDITITLYSHPDWTSRYITWSCNTEPRIEDQERLGEIGGVCDMLNSDMYMAYEPIEFCKEILG